MSRPKDNIIKERNLIDKIDNQIFELFNKRLETSKKIGQSKIVYKKPINDKAREAAIINRLTNDFKNKIKPRYIETLLETIFSISKDIQKLKK